ncbi:MAG: type II 3-dehydroquinate dehydratase [Oligoflexia bacterium]|nr:type II 3-dehydroquinate dehydratase [Oligoflexia bacterium]
MHILILHGPNLNLLGVREPDVYGHLTLAEVDRRCDDLAAQLNVTLCHHQDNSEGGLIDRVHAAMADCAGVVVNPGGYTHTSVALRDALAGAGLPFVEVHLSNVYKREPFRHHSMLAPLAVGQVAGFGAASYTLGLRALVDWLRERSH